MKIPKTGLFHIESDEEEMQAVAFLGPCTVLEAALAAGIKIPHSCGGMGSCGTCRVVVMSGADGLEQRSEVELEMSDARGFREDERLSCQIQAVSGLKLVAIIR